MLLKTFMTGKININYCRYALCIPTLIPAA
jgi:hypothetical protein